MTKPPPLDLHGTVPLADQFAPDDAATWRELALTSGRTLARVRSEINELTKSVKTIAHSSPAVRVILLESMIDRLAAALDGKDTHDR